MREYKDLKKLVDEDNARKFYEKMQRPEHTPVKINLEIW